MGQGRCVRGLGPCNSHPAAEGHIPEKGNEVPVREPMAVTPGRIRERKVQPHLPLDSHGAAAAFCYAGPLLRQAGGPPELPRWGLGIWPEQDKEQYKHHTAHL